MQPDPIAIIKGVKLLAAISLLCVNYLAILPYFHKPEEFFIKSLRPESDSQFTHKQLLFRAFVGVGFISTGVWALAFTLAFSVVSDIAWWMWPAITFGAGTIVGAAEYAYFRLVRYRRLEAAAFKRKDTSDKFHILHPWKIPNPATRTKLWLIAGFDALLLALLYIAIAIYVLPMPARLSWIIPAIAVAILVLVAPERYRRMRRQYKPILNQDEEAGRGGYLSYIGPSNLSRREKTTIAIIAAAALVACFAIPLLWILWRSQA